MEQKLSPRRRAYDLIMRTLVWLCAAFTCGFLLFLIGYIFLRGAPGVTGPSTPSTSRHALYPALFLFAS